MTYEEAVRIGAVIQSIAPLLIIIAAGLGYLIGIGLGWRK